VKTESNNTEYLYLKQFYFSTMTENMPEKSFHDKHDKANNRINNRTTATATATTTTSVKWRQCENHRCQKIAFERAKQLYKARIRNKLKETHNGRELLLGRSIFKQQQQNDKKRNYFANLEDSNNSKQHDGSNYYVRKYLEHRAIRCLGRMKKQTNFALQVKYNTTISGPVVLPTLVRRRSVLVKSEYDVAQNTKHSQSPDETLTDPIPNEILSGPIPNEILSGPIPNESLSGLIPDENLSMMK